MVVELAHEGIWFDKWRYDDAEKTYYEKKSGTGGAGLGSLASQIAKARQEIQNTLASQTPSITSSMDQSPISSDVLNIITKLEGEKSVLQNNIISMQKTIDDLCLRLSSLESSYQSSKCRRAVSKSPPPPPKTQPEAAPEADDDDDVDLFGSDEEEDEEANRVRDERLKAYAEKKSKKPGPIAKSSVLLDCKPWDDETDMKAMEAEIRKIEMDGLKWGAGKLVPLAYGIMKLSILCTVEDEKVSIDDLIEKITENEDFVQSVDVGAFNKI